MNKLTEEQISDIWNKADNSRREESYLSQDVFDLILHVQHLSALLEEKDKALEFYADEENYTIGNFTRIENDMVYDWESKVQQDFGTKAKASLTSYNNEGEKI